MGLTIHYSFEAKAQIDLQVKSTIENLQQIALRLPFKEVGEICDFIGQECNPNAGSPETLLVQAAIDFDSEELLDPPKRIIGFTTLPGKGSERANFALCRRASFKWTFNGFCKTQGASDPDFGGVENFLRSHLALITLLDSAKQLGILESVKDEGAFWQNRDVDALVDHLGCFNQAVVKAREQNP